MSPKDASPHQRYEVTMNEIRRCFPRLKLRFTLMLAAGLAGAFLGRMTALAEPSADGLYAGFFTARGNFWCRLESAKAPRTVANFVGLAEGTRPWINFKAGKIERRPYYNGVTFHRTIDKFMIQGGSPNGLGTDGPGYQFADEFNATLRHSKAGILSMANSGKNSNGSQFFVTVTNTPWLDGVHSIFGEVVEGMDVVHAISKLPADANGKPVAPVTISEVRILRIGTFAQAYDPSAVRPVLPDVGMVPAALLYTPTSLNLLTRSRTNHYQHVFYGTDLVNWTSQTIRNNATNLGANALRGQPRLFFRVLDGGIEP